MRCQIDIASGSKICRLVDKPGDKTGTFPIEMDYHYWVCVRVCSGSIHMSMDFEKGIGFIPLDRTPTACPRRNG